MNPWDIIGWTILAIIVLLAVLILWAAISSITKKVLHHTISYYRHIKTRNIKPKEGQKWYQDGVILTIKNTWPNGQVTMKSGAASWNDTDEEWKNRVKNYRLFLINED